MRKARKRRRRHPRARKRLGFRRFLPAIAVLLFATGGVFLLRNAYITSPSSPSVSTLDQSLTIRVGSFTDEAALESFLSDFLPWAHGQDQVGVWGGGGASVQIHSREDSPEVFVIEWGPHKREAVTRFLEQIREKWGLGAEVF